VPERRGLVYLRGEVEVPGRGVGEPGKRGLTYSGANSTQFSPHHINVARREGVRVPGRLAG